MSNEVNNFSLTEEFWHSITHGLGLLLSIIALASLIYITHDAKTIHLISALIYGISLVVMYGSSTIYHASKKTDLKKLFQKFDHSAIYFLIAGTYTPIVLVSLGDINGWSIFFIEWSIATLGITLKFLYPNRFEIFSLIAYVVMGWLIVIVIDDLKSGIDILGFYLIVAGGVAYTGGIIFYIKDYKNYWHAIRHIFVLAGSILQFLAIYLFIL